jgi:CHRD domain/Carboxypeptidase regulatory-like domain
MKVLKNLFLLAIIISALVGSALSQRFVAKLDGVQETPPTGSTGTGFGNVVVSPDGTSMTVNMGFTGLGTAANASHIHQGAVGVAGGVIFGLAGVPAATGGTIPQQTFALSAPQLATLQGGQYYFNVHTAGFGGGEIRGQIVAPTCDTAGPIEVEATAGTIAPTAYPTLAAAFAAINAGTHQGAIDVQVCGNTTETVTAALNDGAVLPAVYTSVNVYPVGGARTITGSIIGAIIKLNGADNVTIDGRLNGIGTARSLSVINSNTSTATAAVWLSSLGPGLGSSNNIVRNLELACGATQNTSTSTTFGIIMSGTAISITTNGDDNDNNQFLSNRIIRSRYGIVTRGVTTNLNINPVVADNIIGPAAFGADEIGKGGIFMQADTGAVVTRNTVQFVGGDFANTPGGSDRVGIGIGTDSWSTAPTTLTSNTYTVTRNIVHDVIEERTFSSIGVLLATTGGGVATNDLVANNFIYNVKANGTSGDNCAGIGIAGGHTSSVVNNSVSMTGDVDPNPSASATSMFGSGIRIANANGTTHLNMTVSNNSVYMDLSSSSAPTVRYYAISGNSSAYTFTAENFNNVYINPANTQLQTGGLGSVSGVTLTTQFATLANWQAAYTVPQDANSIQANPNYASNTADLHLIGTSPNINAGTTIAAVTVDIDNEARPNGIAYDIGADEFVPQPGMLQLSAATYGGNEGTTLMTTVNRVSGSSGAVGVTVTLTNGTGIGGAACGVGVDFVNPGPTVLSFADTITIQPFNVVLCPDAVTDPSETFNITLSLPTGGATLGSPTAAVVTITDVPPPFNGAYTVGGGGNYPSLTNVGGIFEAMNLAGASGPVTINITSDLTGETGAVALNPIAGNPAVLIKPSGAPRTISGVAPIAVIRINGADNIRIDGSTAAMLVGGNPALRQLTVQNLSTSGSSGVIHIGSATESSNGNTVQNVNAVGALDTVVVTNPITLSGITTGGATPGSVAVFVNNNNRIENCSVRTALFGIASLGVIQATPNTGTVITQNDMTGTGTARIKRVGIFIHSDNGGQVTQNSIGGIDNTGESADAVGIGAGSQGISDSTTTTTVGVQNMMIARNKINGISQDATFSAVGIIIAGVTGTTNTIANNMVSGVIADGDLGDFPTGIFVTGVTGSITKVFYNSVSMTGDRSALLTPAIDMNPSFALSISGTDPIVELKNNIFYTTQAATLGGADATSYAIGTNSTTFANLDSDFNDFFSTGTQDGGFRSGSLDRAVDATTEVDYATVALWSAAVADDVNSVTIGEVNPLFVNPVSNLRIPVTSPVIDKGIPVSVLDDYDGTIRSVVGFVGGVPDLGADEFHLAPTAANANIRGRLLTPTGRGLMNAYVVLTNTNTGEVRYARSTSLGYFNFQDLATGNFYVVEVQSKRYQFNSQSFTLDENLDDLVLTANEGQTK